MNSKVTRVRVAAAILTLAISFVLIAYASFEYNTKRFIENPELLGLPTAVPTTDVTPQFVVVTQDPAHFDNGLDDDDWGTPFPRLDDPEEVGSNE